MTTPRLSGLSLPQRLLLSLVVGMMGVLLLWSSARLWIEWQWFAQFGFSGVLLLRWTLQLAGLGVGLALALGLQLWLRHLWRLPRLAPERHTLPPLAYGGVLTLLAGLQVVALTIALWLARRLLLAPFDPSRLHGLIALEGPPSLPMLLASALVLLALLIRPMATARLVAGVLGAAGAMALARGWSLWSVALVARDAGITEPLLGADISFALLRFPALAFLLTLLSCLLIGGLACGLWGVLARPPQLSDGRFAGFTPPQLRW